MFLSWRSAVVDADELLRTAVPRGVEHAEPVSAVVVLPVAAAVVVVGHLQPAAPVPWRDGDVFPGASMDRELFCRGCGWSDVHVHCCDAELPDVAGERGCDGVAAVGGVAGETF